MRVLLWSSAYSYCEFCTSNESLLHISRYHIEFHTFLTKPKGSSYFLCPTYKQYQENTRCLHLELLKIIWVHTKFQFSQAVTVFYWNYKLAGLSVPNFVCVSNCGGNLTIQKGYIKERQRLCFNILHSNYYSRTLRKT